MPINRYQKAKELLLDLKGKELLTLADLTNEIIMNLGSDNSRTVKPYVQLMLQLKMIKLEENNNVTILI